MLILKILVIWTLLSIPLGIFAGKFIAVGNKAPQDKS